MASAAFRQWYRRMVFNGNFINYMTNLLRVKSRSLSRVKSRGLSRGTYSESSRVKSRGLSRVKSRGFTLIEIAVLILILVMLIVGGVSSLSSSKKRRDVKTTAEKLKTLVLEARSQALTPADTAFGLQKIQVRIYQDMAQIPQVEVFEIKGAGAGTPTIISGLNLQVPTGTSIAPPTGTGNMSASGTDYYYFSFVANASNSLGQLTDTNPSGATNVIINVASNETYQLTVNKTSGGVEMVKI